MGKVKTRRQKYHASAAKLKKATPESDGNDVEMQQKDGQTDKIESMSMKSGGIFKNVNIDLAELTSKLPDLDARSTITSKTLKEYNLTKKEKRQLKHDLWLKRVDTIQAAKKEAKERKKRQQTAVVGDMKPLEDTLPTLELLLKDMSSDYKKKQDQLNVKPKSTKKAKQRQKDMMNDIGLFKQVLEHPAFKDNPGATISEHLKNKIKQESDT